MNDRHTKTIRHPYGHTREMYSRLHRNALTAPELVGGGRKKTKNNDNLSIIAVVMILKLNPFTHLLHRHKAYILHFSSLTLRVSLPMMSLSPLTPWCPLLEAPTAHRYGILSLLLSNKD